MKFKSSFDSMVYIITGFIIFLVAYVIYKDIINYNNVFSFTNISLVGLLAICFCLSVKDYQVVDDKIVINKIASKKQISFAEISSIQRIHYLDSYVRIFGIGGLFGYNGIYLSTGNKLIFLYTNHKGNLIRINRVDNKPVYISPDDAKSFVELCLQKGINVIEE